MVAHYWCFGDVGAVIDVCLPCSVSGATCFKTLKLIVYLKVIQYYGIKVDHLFSGQSAPCIKGATACPLFLTQKIGIMHWSEPKSYKRQFELLHSWHFGFRGQ